MIWNLKHQGVDLPDVVRDDDAASVACRDFHFVCALGKQAVLKGRGPILLMWGVVHDQSRQMPVHG